MPSLKSSKTCNAGRTQCQSGWLVNLKCKRELSDTEASACLCLNCARATRWLAYLRPLQIRLSDNAGSAVGQGCTAQQRQSLLFARWCASLMFALFQ